MNHFCVTLFTQGIFVAIVLFYTIVDLGPQVEFEASVRDLVGCP